MIEVINVTYAYEGGVEAVKGVNLVFKEGTLTAIMGENGAGKTTLLKLIAGLLKPTSGRILVDGVDTRECRLSELARSVALVFQNAEDMFFSETVFDEVAFALRNFGYPKDVIKRRVVRALATMGLRRYANRSPFELSGGEQKRLAMAIILAWSPKYILLDEPTAGQDLLNKEMIRGIVRQLVLQGKAVILVTHDVDFVFELQPRVVVMKDGRVIADGPCLDVLSEERIVREAGLLRPTLIEVAEKLGRRWEEGLDVDMVKRWVAEVVQAR